MRKLHCHWKWSYIKFQILKNFIIASCVFDLVGHFYQINFTFYCRTSKPKQYVFIGLTSGWNWWRKQRVCWLLYRHLLALLLLFKYCPPFRPIYLFFCYKYEDMTIQIVIQFYSLFVLSDKHNIIFIRTKLYFPFIYLACRDLLHAFCTGKVI